tara:strand:+ start:401 stop:745 length:345 start_codon:yes stop_codon:yes gene_type:complete
MILDLPDEILRKIILSIECDCINHRFSIFITNKAFFDLLNNVWFYKNIISLYQNQKKMYFHKYRKYMVKYNHLKHQVEDIWINQSDDSDTSISSMDILEFFEDELLEGDYIDNM